MFSNVSRTPAQSIAHNVVSCFASLAARCRRDQDVEHAEVAAQNAVEPVAIATPRISLPSEIWGEIATFSARRDLLNLRATCHHIKPEAERSITTLSIKDTDHLYALADAPFFKHIKVLRLYAMNDASMYHFSRSLRLQQRTDLLLTVRQSEIDTLSRAEMLSNLPLAGLTIVCMRNLNHRTVQALKTCRFPITLAGQFSHAELAMLSRIPTLIRLDSASETFNDGAADLLAAHPTLRTLSIRAFQNLSEYGVQRIAAVPHLRRLSLYETDYLSTRITTEGVRALAACRTLTYLHFHTSVTPLSDAGFAALATSTSLATLEISIGPGVRHIANIASLESLTLRGRCLGSSALDVTSARALAQMPKLKSLSIEFAGIAPQALATIVQRSGIQHLQLRDAPLQQDALAAIMGNHHLTTLTLHAVAIDAEQITALSFHPTLQKLRINHINYPLQPAPVWHADYA